MYLARELELLSRHRAVTVRPFAKRWPGKETSADILKGNDFLHRLGKGHLIRLIRLVDLRDRRDEGLGLRTFLFRRGAVIQTGNFWLEIDLADGARESSVLVTGQCRLADGNDLISLVAAICESFLAPTGFDEILPSAVLPAALLGCQQILRWVLNELRDVKLMVASICWRS